MTTPASPLDPDVAMYRAEKARLAPKFAMRQRELQRTVDRLLAHEEELRQAALRPGRPSNPKGTPINLGPGPRARSRLTICSHCRRRPRAGTRSWCNHCNNKRNRDARAKAKANPA